MKTVWIIWGLWPETTAEFYLDLIFSVQKRSSVSRSAIIISSVPLPYEIEQDLIEKNIGAERYIPFLVDEARKLEQAWVDFIVMPCNSLHVFIKDIRDSVNIPVLSIVEETVKFMKNNNFTKVWIVSTSATIENKLYEHALEKESIDYVTPDWFQQAKMGKFIMNLVLWKQNNQDREEFIKIISDFEDKNIDCVALACTDLQLLIPKNDKIQIFDTMKILSDATVEKLLS